jgi:tetratricopeptide (TPR) repeat protein
MLARLGDAPVNEQRLYRILQVAFIAIIAAFLIASGFLLASGERLRRLCIRGWEALDNGDYESAVDVFDLYLRERPFDSDTYEWLALACFHTGRYDRCIDALRHYAGTAMSSDPGDDEAYRQRLIRYVECVKEGREYGEEPPRFFSLYAPKRDTESVEVDDAHD